jgi:hypothetical protein
MQSVIAIPEIYTCSTGSVPKFVGKAQVKVDPHDFNTDLHTILLICLAALPFAPSFCSNALGCCPPPNPQEQMTVVVGQFVIIIMSVQTIARVVWKPQAGLEHLHQVLH